MLTQFKGSIKTSSDEPIDIAKRYCLETIQKCANFLPSFAYKAKNPNYSLAELKNSAIFAPFDFSQLSANNQLPPDLGANLENWYEYRTYHFYTPDKKSGSLLQIAFNVTTNLQNADQVEITYYPYNRREREWDWESPTSYKMDITNENQHTELVIDYESPTPTRQGMGL